MMDDPSVSTPTSQTPKTGITTSEIHLGAHQTTVEFELSFIANLEIIADDSARAANFDVVSFLHYKIIL